MFEQPRAKPRYILSIIVVAAMVLSAIPFGTAGPSEGGAGSRAVTDNTNDLIIPEGEIYEMYGCHTYKKSVQILGVLNIKPYDGNDDSTGKLYLNAPNITIGGSGGINGAGRGYGGGGGGCTYQDSSAQGGKGGTTGNGGDGGRGYSWYYYYNSGGGGGGSNNGLGGSGYNGGNNGAPGTALKGGDGGTASSYSGGTGGSGFGGGGGGGGAYYVGAGGGGGGGSGGKDATVQTGGKGAGSFGGAGGASMASGYTTGNPGKNGGYMALASNGDSSLDLSVVKGSGGGGGGGMNYGCGGAGGGGAGGASVVLDCSGSVKIGGSVTTTGAGGGQGGNYASSYYGGAGGGGAGGGIAISGQKVIITGIVNALGMNSNVRSAENGGTVKVLYAEVLQKTGDVQGGRLFINGRPKMTGLLSPANDTQVFRKPMFKWNPAIDPEGDPITYDIDVSSSLAFTSPRRKTGIEDTNYSFENPLAGVMYWRVRAADPAGAGGWSEVRKINVDDKKPVSRIAAIPEFVNSQTFKVSWSGEDTPGGSGIATYTVMVSDNGGEPYAWLKDFAGTEGMFAGIEAHTYRFWSLAMDFASNTEAQNPETVVTTTVDSVAPLTSITAINPWQSTPRFIVGWTGRDATSGVADYTVYVSIDGADFVPWLENTTESSAQYVGAESHKYTFFVLGRDLAGNIQNIPGPEKYISTRVDGTAPATAFSPSAPHYGEMPTYVKPTSIIYLNCTDNFAGVNQTFYVIDSRIQQEYSNGFRESQGGSHNVTYWSMDEAGNEEAKRMTWFWVDGDVPVTTLAFIGPNWTTETKVFISGQTLIAFDANDKGSGINRTIYNIDGSGNAVYKAPFKLPKAGLHSMKYQSIDNLAQEDVEKNVSVVMDIWSPNSVALVESRASGQDIIVEFRGTDLESGLAGVYYRVTRKGEPALNFANGTQVTIPAASDHSLDGTYVIDFYALDNVGNREQTRTLEVVIDTVGTLTLNIKGNPSVTDPVFRVVGTGEPGSTVTVNGLRVLVRADGSFDYEMELKDGKNKIVVVSTDAAGNSVTTTKYATYTKPQETGMIIPIIVVVVIIAAVAFVAVLMLRPKRGPAVMPPPAR
jgi:hypothetical protein